MTGNRIDSMLGALGVLAREHGREETSRKGVLAAGEPAPIIVGETIEETAAA